MSRISVQNTVSEERLMAAAAHSTSALPVLGILGSLEIWLTQRKWSRFVAFHALQSVVYQIFSSSVLVVLGIPGAILLPLNLWLLLAQVRGESAGGFAACSTLLVIWLFLLLGTALVLVIIGLLSAASILRGKDVRYPVLGRWLKTYMEDRM